jgi:hypothetical protein
VASGREIQLSLERDELLGLMQESLESLALRLGMLVALATTIPIESALSVTRRVTARVTRWRDGEMRRRWCVAGLLRAESKFRRVKGHRAIPGLLKALETVIGATALNRA